MTFTPGTDSIRRNIRRRRFTATYVMYVFDKTGVEMTPKLERWLMGRIAWEAGRKRTGK